MNSPVNESQLLALIKDYTAQLKQDPSSEVFCQLANSYVGLGLVDSAVQTLQQGLTHHPRNVEGQLLLSALLVNSEQYDEAVAGYERLLKQCPDSIDALLGLAQLNFAQANLDRAQFYLEQARLLRPEHARVLELTQQLNDSVCAEGDTAKLPLVTATVAELYYRQGLTEKALAVYKTLVYQQPQNQVFHARLKELQEQTVVKSGKNSDWVERRLQSWLSVIQRRRKNV